MPKPVLLLAFADPTRELRIAQEQRAVRDALRDAEGIDGRRGESRWEIVERSNATLDDLRRAFADHRNRVVGFHYAGHATGDRLLLESADGARRDAHATGLAGFLGEHRARLQFVFLNACSTGGQVDALLRAGVPAVIATSQAIRDDVAILLATAFYSALAGGAGLRRAFEEAQAIVRAEVGAAPRDAYREPHRDAHRDAHRGLDLSSAEALGIAADTWPWAMTVAPGADVVDVWGLGAAIGDHTLGLPPLPPGDLPPSPYRRLLPFTEREAHVFFGRGATIHALYDRCKDRAGAPIVLLHGQSGAGKSSLVDAGLRPRLAAEFDVRYARRDAALGLGGTLRAALGAGADDELAAAWRAQSSPSRPLVVILDQVEEAYTRAPNESDGAITAAGGDGELAALARDLAALFGDPATRPPGRVLLAFRKEWLPEVEARLAAERLFYAKDFLARLDEEGVVEAIVGPGRIPQYRLELVDEEGLAHTIARDLLRDPDSPVAPTLQVLLSKMWAAATARADDGVEPIVFDAALYRKLRKGAALGEFLDEQLAALGTTYPDAVSSGLALDLLAFHTTPLATAARREWPELSATYRDVPDLRALVGRCVDLSLLADVVRRSGDVNTGENLPVRREGAAEALGDEGPRMLSHDTLAPIVRRAFEGSVRPGQRARRILEARAGEWAEGATGRPLDDTDLAHVEAGEAGMRAWTEAEGRLVAASAVRRARDAAARAAQAQAARTRRWLMVAGSAFVAAAGVAAWRAGNRAQEAATRARQAALVAAAVAQEDPVDGALLLATLDTNVALDGMLQTIGSFAQEPVPRAVFDAGGMVFSAAISANGLRIAAVVMGEGLAQGVLRTWRADGFGPGVQVGDTLVPFDLLGGVINDLLAISPDGRRVAWDDEGRVSVANADGSGRITGLPRYPSLDLYGATMTLADDDASLVLRTKAGVISRWRATRRGGDWTEVIDSGPVGGRNGASAAGVAHVESGPPEQGTGKRSTNALTRRGLVRHVALQPQRPGARVLRPTVPTPRGRASSRDGRRARDTSNRERRTVDSSRVTPPHSATDSAVTPPATPAAASQSEDSTRRARHTALDGTYLTVEGSQIRVWDPRGALNTRQVRGPEDQMIRRIAFGARGTRFLALAIGRDSAARVWSVDGRALELRAGGDTTRCVATLGAISADERHVAILCTDSTLRVWAADSIGPPRTIGRVEAHSVVGLAFSLDERAVLSVHQSGRPRRWPIESAGLPPARLKDNYGPRRVSAPSFSADGRRFATISYAQPPQDSSYSLVDLPPNDSLLVTSVDGRFRRSFPLGRDYPESIVALSADGTRVVRVRPAGVTEVVAEMLDVDAGQWSPVGRLPGASRRYSITDPWNAAFSPDGKSIAFATSADEFVRVFAADGSGQTLALPTAAGSVTAVAYRPDGRLFVGTSRGAVSVFVVDQPSLLGYMRRVTTGCLKVSLRRTYLDESAEKAQRAFDACERAHGRTPPVSPTRDTAADTTTR